MIRRRFDGGCLLIAQSEHARVAAEIASSIGGAFAAPSDVMQLAAALRAHSSGFVTLDDHPPLSPAGRPASFDELPLPTLLDAWSRSSESALVDGPYLGMLVSLLCLQRTAAVATGVRSLRETFQINKLQHRQIEIQEQLRPQSGLRSDLPTHYGLPEAHADLTDAEAQFFYDYRLMLFCIQLSLEICAARNSAGKLPPTPPAPRLDPITIEYRAIAGRYTLTPFPLHATVTLAISARHLSQDAYDHERELHEALASAPAIILPMTLQP